MTERDTGTLSDDEILTTGATGEMEPEPSGDDDSTDADTGDSDDMDADSDDTDA
jgi:hypothetical protein